MAIRTFVLTDQWKTPSTSDAEGTGSILRHGISGDVTLTPVVPPGLRVEDDPRAWAMLSRPLRASYHLGRLIGPDGRDGVRLLGWVDEQPVSWRVERELRFNGERLPRLPTVTITPVGGVVHLPDAAPVDETDLEVIGQVLVDIDAVRDELAAAVDAAPRAEEAATRAENTAAGIAADADRAVDAAVSAADSAQGSAAAAAADADRAESAAAGVDQVVSDAAGVLAGEIADDVTAAQSARTGAESARDQAATKADEAAASATLADGRATDAEGAVASIAAHATDAEGAAGRAAASESNAASSATAAASSVTTAQGHADRAATEAGAAAHIAAQEKIAQLVGDAPDDLDTIYELAAAFENRGDAIEAIHAALANRVRGNHSSVISSTVPGAGTPTNQITFVVEGE